MHAYVKSKQGRRRFFLHERASTGPLYDDRLSFLQQRFLQIAYDEYGQDKSDIPSTSGSPSPSKYR